MTVNVDGPSITNKEDTISLIDLLAVILKYRKLIIVITLVSVVLGVLVYYLYPPYSLAKAERERMVEVNMSLMSGSSFDGGINEVEGINLLMQSLTDPSNILTALKIAGYNINDESSFETSADPNKTHFVISMRIIENKGINGPLLMPSPRLYSVRLDKTVVYVSFKDGNSDKAASFFNAMLLLVERDLRSFVQPLAKLTAESFERLLEVKYSNETIETTVAQGYRSYYTAKALAAGTASPLTLLRKPYVLVPELSLSALQNDIFKKVIILEFGVFFMAVFAAFMLQYIETVREDPDSIEKLRNALKKS